VIAFLLASSLSSPALAAQAQEHGSSDRVGGMTAIAGFTVREAHSNAQESVEVFIKVRHTLRLPDGSPWIDFVARRQATDGHGSETTTWTNSESCPALRNTLIWLTTLVAPRIEIPGITPNEASPEGRRPRSVTEDGLQTVVWGRGTQPNHIANTRVEISSNGGLIAEFGRAAKANLAACWSDQHPSA
jgi:hypothetical protein